MTLFRRPHVCSCKDYVEIEVDLQELRALPSYEVFWQAVETELRAVYGDSVTPLNNALYSTCAAPTTFSSELNAKLFETLKNYDEGCALKKVLGSEHDTAVEEVNDMEAQIDPTVRRTKKEREDDAVRREQVRTLKRQYTAKTYEVECLEKRLANLFRIHSIRVPLQ